MARVVPSSQRRPRRSGKPPGQKRHDQQREQESSTQTAVCSPQFNGLPPKPRVVQGLRKLAPDQSNRRDPQVILHVLVVALIGQKCRRTGRAPSTAHAGRSMTAPAPRLGHPDTPSFASQSSICPGRRLIYSLSTKLVYIRPGSQLGANPDRAQTSRSRPGATARCGSRSRCRTAPASSRSTSCWPRNCGAQSEKLRGSELERPVQPTHDAETGGGVSGELGRRTREGGGERLSAQARPTPTATPYVVSSSTGSPAARLHRPSPCSSHACTRSAGARCASHMANGRERWGVDHTPAHGAGPREPTVVRLRLRHQHPTQPYSCRVQPGGLFWPGGPLSTREPRASQTCSLGRSAQASRWMRWGTQTVALALRVGSAHDASRRRRDARLWTASRANGMAVWWGTDEEMLCALVAVRKGPPQVRKTSRLAECLRARAGRIEPATSAPELETTELREASDSQRLHGNPAPVPF